MARRWPSRRLKRVDFPTLGRPTIATIGSMGLAAGPLVEADRDGNAEGALEVGAGPVVEEHLALLEAVRRKQHAIHRPVRAERALDVLAHEEPAHRDGVAEVLVRHDAERRVD